MAVTMDPEVREVLQDLSCSGRMDLPGPRKPSNCLQDFEIYEVWRVDRVTLLLNDARQSLAGGRDEYQFQSS